MHKSIYTLILYVLIECLVPGTVLAENKITENTYCVLAMHKAAPNVLYALTHLVTTTTPEGKYQY